MIALQLKLTSYHAAQSAIRMIRQRVFQQEQQVDPALDFDGLDETVSHIVAYDAGAPVATARLRPLNQHSLKLERMAVLSDYRGKGIGRDIVEFVVSEANRQFFLEIKLNAQVQAQAFYQRLGFVPNGEIFEDAGILHIEMLRSLH